jgi:hypothetical protein
MEKKTFATKIKEKRQFETKPSILGAKYVTKSAGYATN